MSTKFVVALFLSMPLVACSSSDDEGGGGGPGVSAACDGATGNDLLKCDILKLVNQERAKGANCDGDQMPPVGPLEMNSALRTSARLHAEDMADNNYFSHTGQNGSKASQRMKAAGYDGSGYGENIAAGSSTAEKTMGRWMTSSGHCKNIMRGNFVHLGGGYAHNPSNKYRHLGVQNFGRPRRPLADLSRSERVLWVPARVFPG